MTTAKIFQSGNSQAVRLPKAFRFSADEVDIFRRGDEVVLREKWPKLGELLDELPPWPDDVMPEDISDPPPQERKDL
jgi:antitoxin VapB